MPQFDDKTVLVTGGNDGIGRAIALAFAREGANVVIAARRVKQGEEVVAQIRGEGGSALFVETDVSIATQVHALVSTCVSAFGGLNYAVNNAGIEGTPFVPTADYDEDVWDRVLRVNLTGTWLCMKYEIPELLKQKNSAIVNMSSAAGLKGTTFGSAYTASKHGIIGLTRAAAREYAGAGLRINAICPAVIETDMADRAYFQDERLGSQTASWHPLGRIGRPEEVAAAALWLCSDGASFTTGHALPVDGGFVL